MATIPVLHAVTDERIVLRDGFLDDARRVMRIVGGRGAVHLRAPRIPPSIIQHLAAALATAQLETGAWVVVCDHVAIARAEGARGVQLTSQSIGIAAALGADHALAVGASVHSVEAGQRAAAEGASWLVASRVLEPPSGGEDDRTDDGRGLGFLRRLAQACPIPVVAMGGIHPEHVRGLREVGAYGVAAIRGVWGRDDAAAAAAEYLSAYDASPAGTPEA